MQLNQYTTEIKKNLSIAYPVMLGQLGHVLVGLADNIMVGRLGAAHLAAVSLANGIFFLALAIGLGFTFAITPLIAESDGANDQEEGRSIFENGLLISWVIGVFLFIAMLFMQPLLNYMDQPQEVVQLAIPYFRVIAFSLIPLLIFQGYKQFADGLSWTKFAMRATIIANIINVILNYFLIYGIWIFPKLEIIGAGIGTLISRIVMLVFMIYIFHSRAIFKPYLRKFSFKYIKQKMITKLLLLGYPTALQMFFEFSLFTAVVVMAGMIGVNEQAANQIALNLSAMTFMIAVGLGVTATIRVGNQKGAQNYPELRRIGFSIFFLMIVIDAVFAIAFILLKDYVPWLYIDDIEVVKIASSLIVVAGLFQLSDGFQATVLGALRGLQDVTKPMGITFIAYWVIGIPTCYYLGFHTSLGTTGLWYGLFISLTASAIMLIIRFHILSKNLILKSK